jgi:cytochrome c peroxidase
MMGVFVVLALAPGADADLGRRLFFERRLSSDRTLSCASCHDPEKALTGGRALAKGVSGRKGNRNTPTLVNRGDGLSQIWDGRVASLEKQALQPIVNPNELNMSIDAAVRLRHEGGCGCRARQLRADNSVLRLALRSRS